MSDPALQTFLLDVARARGEGKNFHDLMQMTLDFLKSKSTEYAGGRRDQFLEQANLAMTQFASLRGTSRATPQPERVKAMRLLTDLLSQLEAAVPKTPVVNRRTQFMTLIQEAQKEHLKKKEAHRKARLARGLSEQATDGKPGKRIPIFTVERPELDLSTNPTEPLKDSLAAAVRIVKERYAKWLPILSDLDSQTNRVVAAKRVRDAALLDAMPIGASRFGGLPDLPSGIEWPTIRGKKVPFVAQLNLSEFPAAHSLLPANGFLFVFVIVSNDEGFWPRIANVFYHAGDASTLVRSPLPANEEIYPDWHDERVYEVFQAVADAGSRDKLGWFFGEFEFDQTPGEIANELFAEGDDWINLLAVQSNDSMLWSDSGDLYLIVRRSDLEKRDFSHVLATVCSS